MARCVYVYMCRVFLCVEMHTYICIYAHMHMYVCTPLSERVCMCAAAAVCVCVCVCVRVCMEGGCGRTCLPDPKSETAPVPG